jgi:hypothetical protein
MPSGSRRASAGHGNCVPAAAPAARVVDKALGLCRGHPFAGPPGPFAEAERLRLTGLATLAAEDPLHERARDY